MTDEKLIARAREIARDMFVSVSDRDRLAAGLLKELADRLEGRAAARQRTPELTEAEAVRKCNTCAFPASCSEFGRCVFEQSATPT